jgi:hypothetical protein
MGQKLYVVITADGTPLSGRIGTLEPPGPIFYTKGEAIKKGRMFRGRVVSVESYYKMGRGLRRNPEEGEVESDGRRRMLERLREMRRERLQKPSKSFEFIVQGYYPGSGWEDLTTADNYWEALQDKKAYEENERQYAHRLIKRRIKKISTNRRRGLRRNPETKKHSPIPGMFYSIWFSGRGGQTAKLVVKGEILKKASISNLSRMFPYFEMNKLQKLHTAGPYSSFDEAFLNR